MLGFPRFERGSLLTTLTIRLVVTTVLMTVTLMLLLFWQLRAHVDTIHDRSLTNQAQDLIRHIEKAPDGQLSLNLPPSLAAAYADIKSSYQFQIRDSAGKLLFSSAQGAVQLDNLQDSQSAGRAVLQVPGIGGSRIYAASVSTEGPSGNLNVRVGQSEKHWDILVDEVLEEFLQNIGWVLPLILTLFLIVNIWTVRRSFLPIENISRMASTGGATGSLQLPEDGLPNEIRPLVRAVNSAFTRLGDIIRTQRDFTADAAHELRTPLAVLGANIDTLDDPDVRAALKPDILTMSRIVEQLLKIAQLEVFSLGETETTDLCKLTADTAARLGPFALETGKTLAVIQPEKPVLVHGDRTVLQHGLTNLIENALIHTPPGTRIDVIVEADGKIHVDDSGPGIPEAERTLIFQRFWRKNRSGSGSGIGLAIVTKIAESNNGTVSVSTSPQGGARFTLCLSLHRGIETSQL
jgi:signal transduction histidine kinase